MKQKTLTLVPMPDFLNWIKARNSLILQEKSGTHTGTGTGMDVKVIYTKIMLGILLYQSIGRRLLISC